MKGAAPVLDNSIRTEKIRKITTIGSIHHFLDVLRK